MNTRATCDSGLPGCYVYNHTILTAPTDLLPSCVKRLAETWIQEPAAKADNAEFRPELINVEDTGPGAPTAAPATSPESLKESVEVLGVPGKVAQFEVDLRNQLDAIVVRCRSKVVDRVDLTGFFLLDADQVKAQAGVQAIREYLLTAGIDSAQVNVQVQRVRKLGERGLRLGLRQGVAMSLTYASCDADRRWNGKAPPFTMRLEDVPLSRQNYPAALLRTLDDLARSIRACKMTRVEINSQAFMFEEMGAPRAHEIGAYLVGRGVPADAVKVSDRVSLRYGARGAVMGGGHVVFIDVRRAPEAVSGPSAEILPARSRSRSNWEAAQETIEPLPSV
ncbi:hypothetical protein [Bordetella sp. LUAb4]|uniref:hypothetical protein n=1 Tax=Bordetella sp. LUAb4 TaxID=2843195 RepID=UPI001E2AF278|nr:hypothetical protein [Bordetella sp. LUAb4]